MEFRVTILLKKLSTSLGHPLAVMFEAFMSIGQVPDDWRSAVVTPLFKKGLHTSVETTGRCPSQVSSARLWKK